MNSVRRKIVCTAAKLLDLGIIAVSFALAAAVSLDGSNVANIERLLSLQVTVRDLALFVCFFAFAHFIFARFTLYGSKRLSSRRSESYDVIKATTVITIVLGVASVLLRRHHLDGTFLVVFWSVATGCVVATRLLVHSVLGAFRLRGRNSRQMLVVGTNARAVEFVRRIQTNQKLGYRIVGFSDSEWHGAQDFEIEGLKIVCSLSSLPDYLRVNVVDEVVLALPISSFHNYCSKIVSACEEQGIITRFLPDLFNLKLARTRADEFDGSSVITLYTGEDGWAVIAKRVLDFALSLMLVIVLSPVLIAAAIAIKLNSAGPVLFSQQRMGLHKRRFRIYKFRTMCADAEQRFKEVEHLNEVSGPVFKIKNDPRITSVGRVLRKTSIDELPQLFNVITGEMSLVGPRPLDVRDYELMTQSCANWQRCRFSVRPGITCLWQVNGRSSIPFEQWMELDREYVHGWSLWLDLKILLRTIPVVLKGTGAA